jgi:hypothetical protein
MRAKEVRVSSGLCIHINNEGQASPFVFCVDISPQADQQLADFRVASFSSNMKRGPSADQRERSQNFKPIRNRKCWK